MSEIKLGTVAQAMFFRKLGEDYPPLSRDVLIEKLRYHTENGDPGFSYHFDDGTPEKIRQYYISYLKYEQFKVEVISSSSDDGPTTLWIHWE